MFLFETLTNELSNQNKLKVLLDSRLLAGHEVNVHHPRIRFTNFVNVR